MRPSGILLLLVAAVLAGGAAVGSLMMARVARERAAASASPVLAHSGSPAADEAARPDPGLEGLHIPEFTLLDQQGRTVDQSLFDGRYTIVDFFFTNCPFICPGMTAEMFKLTERLKGTPVQFVSVSVDPENDTPERLADYAAGYGVPAERWRFLTGEWETVERVVRETIMFQISPQEETRIQLPDGSTMANIIHPPHLILVGPDRQVLGMYPYSDPRLMEMLGERAEAAAGRAR